MKLNLFFVLLWSPCIALEHVNNILMTYHVTIKQLNTPKLKAVVDRFWQNNASEFTTNFEYKWSNGYGGFLGFFKNKGLDEISQFMQK